MSTDTTHKRPTNHCPIRVAEELLAFPTLFRSQVSLTPDRVAVIHEDRQLTFAQLQQIADRFAHELVVNQIGKGDCVGLCLDRSAEAIAAMLGVLASGAAFVPLDPQYPVDRLAFMIADASIRVVITQPHYRELLQSGAALENTISSNNQRLAGDIRWIENVPTNSCDLPPIQIDPADVAYVMYTSGSTGKPKGVRIEHAALAAYCFADIDAYQVSAQDRTLQFSTLNFDIAIEEIFPPLLTGGAIVVRPTQRSDKTNELSDIVQTYDVTAIHLATAYWHSWVDLMVATGQRVPASIRLMIVTGEKVSVEHYRRWQSICDHEVLWCNAYGPTETTVSATVFIPDENFDALNMPIGKPLRRYDAFILDDELVEVQLGETGQLFIGGPALAKDYLNQPELTDQAFIQTTLSDGVQRRLYRTGDLARWLDDGQIDFGGRIDHQIKLGSYRIEPGEIEATLNQHPSVLESLVSYDEIDGKKFLVAYAATGARSGDATKIANFLRDRLPPYMIPARYVFVNAFPKTINGKIDRKSLPAPSSGEVPHDADFVAPRNELERKLVDLFQDVLNIPAMGIHDDFFLMGGSSLLVTQVVAKLTSQFRVELPVRDFFANPTAASAAKHLASLLGQTDYDGGIEADSDAMRRKLPWLHADYFPSAGQRLFAVRYEPRKNRRRHAVLLCPAYGHEYQRSYRNLQQFAILLCQHGFDVLRFDYGSTGNSEGDCQLATADRFRQNIRDAASYLRRQVGFPTLSIAGVRMGATLAVTADVPNVQRTVLWDPILNGKNFLGLLRYLHSNALTGQYYFPVQRQPGPIEQLFGHQMTAEKIDSFSQIRLPDEPSAAGQTIVTSADFAAVAHDLGQLSRSWIVLPTDDVIGWHDPTLTNCAFSSFNIDREMLSLLCQGEL